MILNKKVRIRGNSSNLKHFKSLGYDIDVDEYVEVNIDDLSKNSHVLVNVQCDICELRKEISYFSYIRNLGSSNLYTCQRCSYVKNRKTNLEKYGVEYPIQLDEIKQKRKNNNIKKYGVDEPSKLKEVIEKIKNTKKIKYNDENYTNINKTKETKRIKYNNENYTNIDKTKKTNLEKYGVENVFQLETVKNKKKETFIKNYGVDNYSKSDEYKNKKNKFLLKKYDSIYVVKINDDDILLKCDECKEHTYNINVNVLRNRIIYKTILCTICNPVSSSFSSGHETQLQSFIKENYNKEILLNNRDVIGKELDIYLPELKLAFEFNGSYWHSEINKEKNYHLNKTELCEKLDIHLIHIYEYDWINNKKKIKNKILDLLNKAEISQINDIKQNDIYKIKYKENLIICEADRSWSNGKELEKIGFKLIEKSTPNLKIHNKNRIWDSGILKYELKES